MKIIWTDFASDSLFEIRWREFVIRVIEYFSPRPSAFNGFIIKNFYSYLSAFTGLILEALYDCMKTVNNTTTAAMTNPARNTHPLIVTLYAKLLSHLFIK